MCHAHVECCNIAALQTPTVVSAPICGASGDMCHALHPDLEARAADSGEAKIGSVPEEDAPPKKRGRPAASSAPAAKSAKVGVQSSKIMQ